MYETHYDLQAKPFQITTDPKFLWLGEKHSEALATLKYGILENKGFLLLTGDVGTGKTALINRLVKMIDIAAIVATVPDPGLESLDFFNFLAAELKMKKKFNSKGAFLIDLKQFLLKAYAEQKKVLLVIDEAQRLNNELLEQIRLLSNIEMENRKLINIFFVGQSEFNDTLMQNGNRAVRQRISVSYHIEPLTAAETQQYIQHRLKVAGAVREIFNPDAIREIFAFSRGYPRLINIICDHALLTGYAAGAKAIDINVIKECELELQIPIDNKPKNDAENVDEVKQSVVSSAVPQKSSFGKKAGVVAALIAAAALAVYFLSYTNYLNFGESPRWSIQEIAPQEFQGPPANESEAVENPQPDINQMKEVQPLEEAPLDEKEGTEPAQAAAVDEKEAPKEVAPGDTPGIVPIAERKTLVYFKHNSNELEDQYFEALDRIAAFMLQSPAARVSIKGYTDSTGNSSYNISVSQFRANIIKTYLAGKGVDPSKINAEGLGSQNPITTNATEDGRRENRRVEIELNPG
jgi:general secretion pathway protein A